MSPIIQLLEEYAWVLHLFGVVFITALSHAILSRVLNRLVSKAKKTPIIYDEALLQAVTSPATLIIWLLGLSSAIKLVLSHNKQLTVLYYYPQLKTFGLTFAISWAVIRFIQNIEALYVRFCVQHSKEVDKTLVHAVSQLLTVSVVITTALVVMQLFGLPISGLLAFGGIGGAAVAFASKDMLGNFFGGLVVYLDRPFKVGDWIRSPDKEIEGTVEFIGWRMTRIRTFDKRPLYVPNGLFLNICVENPSRMSNRRIKTMIGLRYEDASKVEIITSQIRQMLMNHPEIDSQQTLIVNLVEFGPSSINFMVYTFTKTTQWVKFQAIQQEVLMGILQIIAQNNAECAFPTQTLLMKNEALQPVDQGN